MGAAARTNNDPQQTYKSRLTIGIISGPLFLTARWRFFMAGRE
jgi:hypothetical protein